MTPTSPIITLQVLPAINFALQQNHVPVIRELVITNNTEHDWQQVTIEITSEPACTLSWKHSLVQLPVGASHSLRQFPLHVSAQYLSTLTEKISGSLLVKISAGEVVVHEEHHPINILAFDQWGGIGLLPEMLTAFVTPNHPEIPGIIRNASTILQQWTGSPSFDDYQSRNPDRVRKQMAAIYEAIASLQLIYCTVPASFEEGGQRVRLADTILANKLANCLDMSLLYAACLEAVGIHPLIVITEGHAFAGGWLVNESFADPVNDDPSLITKRIAAGINEIAVVEATYMNAGNAQSFDDAVRAAEQKMLQTEAFVLFIDVKRARFGSIRPLPVRIATAEGWQIKEEAQVARESVLPEDIVAGHKLEYINKIPVTKQRLWERKLLDLTLRNSLLNIRITRSVIQFITIHTGKLEDALANGDEFQILARPSDWENPLRDSGLYQALHQSDPIADLVAHELGHRRIRTYLSDAELSYSLTNLYRASRLSLEENGANTLYIGLGLLRWYETEASERPRFAPILLIPVEIIRKSAQKGYVIRNREEETIMNITLLEMMRQDFGINIGGLETLPRDESGIDVKQVFNIIRQAIMAKTRWDVEEQAILGTFSFSKFILWNDIHNNAEQLCKHQLVASLVSGKLEWEAGGQAGAAAVTDNRLHPAEVALPISSDSSQLRAILSSGQGKSFVLHGPPGTGKSQTITNIIANALYAGKRVLFVAAKKAALDVVESRLESIGIGAFCLELHSNKAKKSIVLEQLKRVTEITCETALDGYQSEAERLFKLRSELNTYVEALHEQQSFGYSLFDVFNGYTQLPAGEDKVHFKGADIENLAKETFTNWQDLAEQLQAAGTLIQHPYQHPLNGVRLQQYTPQVKQQVKQEIEDALHLLQQIVKQNELVSRMLKMEGSINTCEQQTQLVQLSELLLQAGDIPASLLQADAIEQTLGNVTGIAAHGKERDRLRSGLLQAFRKDILKYTAEQTLSEWNSAAGKWFLPKWLKQNSLVKKVRSMSLSASIAKDQVPLVLQDIINYQQEQELLDKATWLPALAGFLWQHGECDWDELTGSCDTVIACNRLAGAILGPGQLKGWRLRLAAEFSEGSKVYMAAGGQNIRDYAKLLQQLVAQTGSIKVQLGIVDGILDSAGNTNEKLTVNLSRWLKHLDQLKDWYNYTLVRDAAWQAGLRSLVDNYENDIIQTAEVAVQFRKGFFRSAADCIITKHSVLSTFNGDLFGEKISKFRSLSKQFETLTRQELYARLSAGIPSFSQEASQSSEIGILQRVIRNNGRAMPIRKLFDLIPNLLHRLTPCMLMSPISVAQYFDTNNTRFDLVIFDEASQMPTCEAVGAIARGSSVIVVGDPKQMPPTNFFSGNNVDEENIEIEDLESILDDCLALSMPSQHLLWHYRSKHESLIAFSNAKYYDNKLLTFPSTDDISSKVQFVLVEGYYDKGKTRQNKFEAKAIVEEVMRRLSDPELSQRSIGIVTFSSVQQVLVEDMLMEVFKQRPDLEKMALESEEPLFIKNLENVQGDERDVILFSIGYGPDQEGKVSLNFGPINRNGGWRRLNVAVSRARYEMKVFSTLRSDQIDLSRTSAEGVAGLKAFLAYAEKSKAALPFQHSSQAVLKTASFENLIADDLRRQGFKVHTQIGASAYKINLGIVDPEQPDRYLLGILTDGKNYYDANTSKDREITQVQVLKMLGWSIHKIWSTEWWEKPEKVMAGIIRAIEDAKINKGLIVERVESQVEITSHQPEQDSKVIGVINKSITTPTSTSVTSIRKVYVPAFLEPVQTQFADEFLWPQQRERIKGQLMAVVTAEAPLSKELLCKRVLNAWGIARQGTRISTYFDALISELDVRQTQHGQRTFFWKENDNATAYKTFRVAASDEWRREADDLPPEEIANVIMEVLRQQISLSRIDLMREVARIFGYSRIGNNLKQAVNEAIDYAAEKSMLTLHNDRVVWR